METSAAVVHLRRQLGAALRRLRINSMLSQVEVAASLPDGRGGRSQMRVSRIELGRSWPTDAELKKMLDLYEATPEQRTEAWALRNTDHGTGTNWWNRYRDIFGAAAVQMLTAESTADNILTYSAGYIPLLFQTEDYVRALFDFTLTDMNARNKSRHIEARLKRRDILTRSQPPVIDAVLSEAAILARVGGRDVMKAQLQELLTFARKPNVSMRVVGFTSEIPWVNFPIYIMEFPGKDMPDISVLDGPRGVDILDQEHDVALLKSGFQMIKRAAENKTNSLRIIESVERSM